GDRLEQRLEVMALAQPVGADAGIHGLVPNQLGQLSGTGGLVQPGLNREGKGLARTLAQGKQLGEAPLRRVIQETQYLLEAFFSVPTCCEKAVLRERLELAQEVAV